MGFVKLPSDLSEWAWANDNATLAVYVRLVLGAAWRQKPYQNVILERGQIATTIPQIAEQSKLTTQQVRTILERLKSTGKITVNRTPKFSIITLIEYDCDTSSNSKNNRQTTVQQQTNNSPATDKQQSYLFNNRITEYQNIRMEEAGGARATASAPAQSSKIQFAERVALTEEEYGKLVEEHGEPTAKWCIQKLNDYKGATGKTYASDYNAILLWVLDSYQENQAKQQPQGGGNPFLNAVINDNMNRG